MSAMEELGMTREKFGELYEEYGGFNTRLNKNNPKRQNDETVYSFLQKGAKSLVEEHADLVAGIAEEG